MHNFRVRIKNYSNGETRYEYFDREEEAKAWCINRSEYYIRCLDSYESSTDKNILYQIQCYEPFDKKYIPDYRITVTRTEFRV